MDHADGMCGDQRVEYRVDLWRELVHRSWADALHQVRDRPAFRELHRVP